MDGNVRNRIRQYFKTKPVEKAWIFGSYSRGEEKPNSDVDILISFVPGTKMGLRYFGMICDLEKMLNRFVDLVIDGDIMPFAHESVEHDKVLVYERTNPWSNSLNKQIETI